MAGARYGTGVRNARRVSLPYAPPCTIALVMLGCKSTNWQRVVLSNATRHNSGELLSRNEWGSATTAPTNIIGAMSRMAVSPTGTTAKRLTAPMAQINHPVISSTTLTGEECHARRSHGAAIATSSQRPRRIHNVLTARVRITTYFSVEVVIPRFVEASEYLLMNKKDFALLR